MSAYRRGLLAALVSLSALTVCAAGMLPTDSLYQLRATLTTQRGAAAGFDLYRGHPTVVSLFYADCSSYCPMLITAVQVYEAQLDGPSRARLRVLLVSFDAAHDTPQRLTELSNLHHADAARWTFASAREPDARRIAELLGFHYRKLPDGRFDHTQVITLVDGEGRVLASTAKLIGDPAFQAKLVASTADDGH
jgi:protein SCO1